MSRYLADLYEGVKFLADLCQCVVSEAVRKSQTRSAGGRPEPTRSIGQRARSAGGVWFR
jgi:hypothetical protein